jgi:hypothetical protein
MSMHQLHGAKNIRLSVGVNQKNKKRNVFITGINQGGSSLIAVAALTPEYPSPPMPLRELIPLP